MKASPRQKCTAGLPYGAGSGAVKPTGARTAGRFGALELHAEAGRELVVGDPVQPERRLEVEESAHAPPEQGRDARAQGEVIAVGVVRGHPEEGVRDVVDVPGLDVAAV